MKLEELKKYNVINFSATIYSENSLLITSRQTVITRQADNSYSHSTIEHQFKASSLEHGIEILADKAKVFYDAFNGVSNGRN